MKKGILVIVVILICVFFAIGCKDISQPKNQISSAVAVNGWIHGVGLAEPIMIENKGIAIGSSGDSVYTLKKMIIEIGRVTTILYSNVPNATVVKLIPPEKTTFKKGESISITAMAPGAKSLVSKVSLRSEDLSKLLSNVKIGETTTLPHTWTFNNLAVGNYSLMIWAENNEGQSICNSWMEITITN